MLFTRADEVLSLQWKSAHILTIILNSDVFQGFFLF